MQRRVVMEQRIYEETPAESRAEKTLIGLLCALVLVLLGIVTAPVWLPVWGVWKLGKLVYREWEVYREERHELRLIEARAKAQAAAQQQPQQVVIYVNTKEEARHASALLQQRGQIAQIEAQTSNPDFYVMPDVQTKVTHLQHLG